MTSDEKLSRFLHETSNRPWQDIRWQLKRLKEYRDGLFTFHPFKVGEWVALRIDVAQEHPDAWKSHNHFMKKGAVAEVVVLDWHPSKFYISVQFDKEYYRRYNYATKQHEDMAVDEKALYSMPAAWFSIAEKPEPEPIVNTVDTGPPPMHICPLCKKAHEIK